MSIVDALTSETPLLAGSNEKWLYLQAKIRRPNDAEFKRTYA